MRAVRSGRRSAEDGLQKGGRGLVKGAGGCVARRNHLIDILGGERNKVGKNLW